MAIQWGPWKDLGSYSVRTGLDLSWSAGSAFNSSDTAVTLTAKQYAQADSWANGNDSWKISGAASASGSTSWSSSNSSAEYIGTATASIALGRSSKTVSVTAVLYDAAGGTADPSVTASITIPARVEDSPAAPSNFTATRVSDTQQKLTWTNNATAQAPYDSLELARRDNVATSYTTIASLPEGSTSFSDTTTRSNRTYDYAIRGRNSGGNSSYVYADIDTTPAAPTSAPTARKDAAGNIEVTAPAITASASHWQVLHAANGVWDANPLATVSRSVTKWTHNSPDAAVTHTYRVRAATDDPVLYSTWGPSSATVQLLAPPNAPSNLSPTAPRDPQRAIVFSWTHNPIDTTTQSRAELQWRTPSGTWQALADVSGSTASWQAPAGTFPESGSIEWRARTWGDHVDPSAWSPAALVKMSRAPVVSITSPGVTLNSSTLTAQWSFFDPEGSAQSRWTAKLYDATGQLLESRDRRESTTTTTFQTRVDDGGTYSVTVTAYDADGIASAPQTVTTSVAYALPPAPTLSAVWQPDDGMTVISVDTVPAGDGQVDVDHLQVWRAGTTGWVLVADGLSAGESVVDMVAPTGTTVVYRALAVSALPSSSASGPVQVETRTSWAFLNYGPGFGRVARVWANLEAARAGGRDKTLHAFAGRTSPVEFAGEHVKQTYKLEAKVLGPKVLPVDDSATFEDLLAVAAAPAPVCFRDPEGIRLWVSVGDVAVSDHLKNLRTASLELTVVDWSEGEEQLL